MAVTAAGERAGGRRRPAVVAWAGWALFVVAMVLTAWLDHLLRRAGRARGVAGRRRRVVVVYALNFSGAPLPCWRSPCC